MLRWSIMFLIVATIAGLLGFTAIAGPAEDVARVFFFVFLAIWLLSLLVFRKTV